MDIEANREHIFAVQELIYPIGDSAYWLPARRSDTHHLAWRLSENTSRKFHAGRLLLFSWLLVVPTMTYVSVLSGLLRTSEKFSADEHAAYLAGAGSNFVEFCVAEQPSCGKVV